MLQIGLCDDTEVHRAILWQFVSNYFSEKNMPIEIYSFSSGEKLLQFYEKNKLDLLFLDIIMGNADGITVSKAIRQKDSKVSIIFCTTHADFALESYDVYAYGYILKPFNTDKLKHLLDRYVSELDFSKREQIIVKSGRQSINILSKEIVFAESRDKYLYIHLSDNNVISCRMKMSDLSAMLPQKYFLQCHQSYFINMHYIIRIDEDTFVTINNNRIPIRKKELKKIINCYTNYLSSKS